MRFFRDFPEVFAVLSEKKDGRFSPVNAKTKSSAGASKKRSQYFQRLGISSRQVVFAELVHGNRAAIVTGRSRGMQPKTDGLVTNRPNIFLAITVADCFPVYFYDPRKKIVGLAHAGWRGTTKRVVEHTSKKLFSLGSSPEDVLVAIGPGIHSCHFEVHDDVLARFKPYKDFILKKKAGKIFVDIPGILFQQLSSVAIPQSNIVVSRECTACAAKRFFSARRDWPRKPQRMIAFIGIRSQTI